MIKPFKGEFPITQTWGNDLVINGVHIYAQYGLKGHNGVDYGTPTGTPILAPHDGKVIEAAFDQYGYGMYVKIENDKEGSILAHLKSFNVNPGDVLTEGTQIGISDNTGNSTGPHLHWGYFRKPRNKSDGYSGTTDPAPYLVVAPVTDEWKTKLQAYNGTFYKPEDVIKFIEDRKKEISDKDKVIGSKDIQITDLTNRLNTYKTKVKNYVDTL